MKGLLKARGWGDAAGNRIATAQQRALRIAMPVLILLCLVGAFKVSTQHNLWWWEPYSYVLAAAAFWLLWVLARAAPEKIYIWSAWILFVAVVFLASRTVLLLSSPMLASPQASWFVLLFACIPVLYIAEYLLLPPRPALFATIATWLVLTTVILIFFFNEWQINPNREGLMQGLIYFLVVNPVYIVVLAGLPQYHMELYASHEQHQSDQQKLRHLSKQINRDPLTGAFSRRYYERCRLQQGEIVETLEAVAMVDLDYFKDYNDSRGHPAGDACLKKVVQCMQEALGQRHQIIRYGGEEFLIFLHYCEGETAEGLMAATLRRVEEANIAHPASPHGRVTLSVGMARQTDDSLEQLVELADCALLWAKQNGRNQIIWGSPTQYGKEMASEPSDFAAERTAYS